MVHPGSARRGSGAGGQEIRAALAANAALKVAAPTSPELIKEVGRCASNTCAAFVIGYALMHEWVVEHARLFAFLSAALPARGGAIFGIRVQGEFAGETMLAGLGEWRVSSPA